MSGAIISGANWPLAIWDEAISSTKHIMKAEKANPVMFKVFMNEMIKRTGLRYDDVYTRIILLSTGMAL